jgi:NAD(P)-dependent dehydrogenase (short-subunit alcohol dehydrogenase family)
MGAAWARFWYAPGMADTTQTTKAGGAPAPTAVVTGGSRGIGHAIARGLARRGYAVTITGRDPARLAEATGALAELEAAGAGAVRSSAPDGASGAERVPEAGARRAPSGDAPGADHPAGREAPPTPPRSFAADLADTAATGRLAAQLREAFPRLDLLVLNAGIAAARSLEETSDAEWDRMFAVNVRAPFVIARELIPALRAAGGRVMVLGSVVSRTAYAHQGAYTASKHALYGLTKVLAKELHEDGVIVQTILPGGVDTDMIHGVRPDIDTTDLIRPEDVADAVLAMLEQKGNAVVDEISLRRRGKQPWA